MFEKFKCLFTTVLQHVYTLLVVFVGWVLFRFTDFESMLIALKAMFGLNGNQLYNIEIGTVIANNIVFIVVCLIAVTPMVKNLAQRLREKSREGHIGYMRLYNTLNLVLPIVLLFLATIALVGDSYNPFIYFRF